MSGFHLKTEKQRGVWGCVPPIIDPLKSKLFCKFYGHVSKYYVPCVSGLIYTGHVLEVLYGPCFEVLLYEHIYMSNVYYRNIYMSNV